MNTFRRHRLVTSSIYIAVATLCAAASFADSVQFQRGEVAPPLAISPSSPTTSDLINFTTPLDSTVYGNTCEAAGALGGDLFLVRDDANHLVNLLYDGNIPIACPLVFDPVIGAEGEFGPLAAGDWVLSDPHNNRLQFTVIPEPASCLLFLIGGLALAAYRRRRFATVRPPSELRHG